MTHPNAKNHVQSRETPRPATSGDECVWPFSQLPFLYHRQFLWSQIFSNTGAQVSVIPPTSAQKKHRHDGFHLQAVNNSPIATYGSQLLTLDLGLRRTFRWVFVIADVQSVILGADFLRHLGLMVDV